MSSLGTPTSPHPTFSRTPNGLPSSDTPSVSFNTEPISLLEVQSVIKGAKSSFHTIPIRPDLLPDFQTMPIPSSRPPKSLPVLLVRSLSPMWLETCWDQANWEGFGTRAPREPLERPPYCPHILCWQAVHDHPENSVAVVHAW